MKIAEILKNNDKGVAFEFFPPKTDKGKESLAKCIESLKEYNPLYVSMTYGAIGSTQERTIEAVDMILKQKDLHVMPHLTCVGSKKEAIRSLLNDYKNNGVDNIMALRGDPPEDLVDFDFAAQELSYGVDLVKFIKSYGHFSVGVAVYPEGHIEAKSIEEDLKYTKQKVDAGADFAVTQMFFNNDYYYRMLDRMGKAGINIPILPGILPLTDIAKLEKFTSVCRTSIPDQIRYTMERYSGNPEDMMKAGLEYTIKQCQDLIKNGINKLHFFTLNKASVVKTILDAL